MPSWGALVCIEIRLRAGRRGCNSR